MYKVVITGAVFLWAGIAGADDDCPFSAARSAELSTDGIVRLEVRAGAGELKVQGENGLRGVQVSGTACARNESQLERVQIRLDREGDTLVLNAEPPHAGVNPRDWFSGTPRLDLEVKVPPSLVVEIEDGSGNLRVANVASAVVRDESGDLEIENIRGSLRVSDGSGNTAVRGVQGRVRINDGSGDFSIAKVVGDVIVTDDGSGSIEIVDVQGNVTIGSDGSGDIRVELVQGSVRVEEDGSGDIRVRFVQHDVTIDGDGSGSIIAENVEGDLIVDDAGSGGVQHEGVRGRVRVASEGIDTGASEEQQPEIESEALQVEKDE